MRAKVAEFYAARSNKILPPRGLVLHCRLQLLLYTDTSNSQYLIMWLNLDGYRPRDKSSGG